MKYRTRRSGAAGFTLIELMVAVAIVGILTAVALPSYRSHVRHANRSQIEAAMMNIAQMEERYFTANNQYCSNSATCSWLTGYEGSANYSIGVTIPGSNSGYDIVATIASGYSDPDCGNLTLSALNQRSSQYGTAANCWK